MSDEKFEFDEFDMLEALYALDDKIRSLEGRASQYRSLEKAKQARKRLYLIYLALKKMPQNHLLKIGRARQRFD